MRRTLACAVAAAALAFSLTTLVGCDVAAEMPEGDGGASSYEPANDVEVLKQHAVAGISAEIESVLNDESQIGDAIMSTTLSDLAGYGIDGVEFVQEYLGDLNYSIGDVNIDGETATVAVTLNFKSLANLASTVGSDLLEFAADLSLEDLPLKELGALVAPVISAAAQSADLFLSQELLLDFEMVNGEWQLTDQAKLDILNAILEG